MQQEDHKLEASRATCPSGSPTATSVFIAVVIYVSSHSPEGVLMEKTQHSLQVLYPTGEWKQKQERAAELP